MILALRTDKPEAELYLYENSNLVDGYKWEAHRKLADELLLKVEGILKKNKLEFKDVSGIIIFTGSGSFTGLRIGTTVANTLAYSLGIPIVESAGENWIKTGLEKIKSVKPGQYVVPKYNAEPNITQPKNK